MLSRDRLTELLGKARGLRLGIAGDFCLDRYGTAEVGGQSRETGDPIVRITHHLFSPGGAANIAWNVAELGAQSVALALVGRDAFGHTLRDVLRRKGVDTERMVYDPAKRVRIRVAVSLSSGRSLVMPCFSVEFSSDGSCGIASRADSLPRCRDSFQ